MAIGKMPRKFHCGPHFRQLHRGGKVCFFGVGNEKARSSNVRANEFAAMKCGLCKRERWAATMYRNVRGLWCCFKCWRKRRNK